MMPTPVTQPTTPVSPVHAPVHVPVHVPSAEVKKGGLPGGILALICIGMLLIGLFGGALVALWLNSRYQWFSDSRRPTGPQYSQFELDDDI